MSGAPAGVVALGLTVLIGPASATAQDTLLDVRTSAGAEVTTVRSDSMRVAVPLRLTGAGIVFPDGSVQSAAAAPDSSTPMNEPGTIVARNSAGRFAAGGISISDTTGPAGVNIHVSGSGYGGLFEIDNPSSSAVGVQVTTNAGGAAVNARTTGAGQAASFVIQNPSNSNPALFVETDGSGPAVWGRSSGSAEGGLFTASGAAPAVRAQSGGGPAVRAWATGAGAAVDAVTYGTGPAARFVIDDAANDSSALVATTTGTASAGFFAARNPSSTDPAIVGHHDGAGAGLFGYSASGYSITGLSGSGTAGYFRSLGNPADVPVLLVEGWNTGPAATFRKQSASGDVLTAEIDTAVVFRVQDDGNVYADGTFNGGGADLAESFAVEGGAAGYEPGDVLVISERTDRTMQRATEAYSSRVAGVYATRPGVLLTEHGAEGVPGGEVPVGVVGVIPTKVTVEGGPIRRGDLLVTSSTPGHAMRGEPVTVNGVEIYPSGAVLGKALEPFDGPGTGVIRVLVNVR